MYRRDSVTSDRGESSREGAARETQRLQAIQESKSQDLGTEYM